MVKPGNNKKLNQREDEEITPSFVVDSILPSATKKTHDTYLHRAKNIIAGIEIASGTTNIFPIDIAEWLAAKSPSVRPATLRQYRAALSYYIQHQSDNGIFNPEDAKSSIDSMSRMRGMSTSRINTSSMKSKAVSQESEKTIISSLSRSKSRFALVAALMFKATIIAGLRPIEWVSATMSRNEPDGLPMLIVRNAKNTNGRSFGEYRTIVILNEGKANIVKKLLSELAAITLSGCKWERTFAEIRRLIYSVGAKHGYNRISLYTARHQFTANMKNTHSRENVAQLLGHGSIDTATSHYGKRRSGHPDYKEFAKEQNNQSSSIKQDVTNE